MPGRRVEVDGWGPEELAGGHFSPDKIGEVKDLDAEAALNRRRRKIGALGWEGGGGEGLL